MSAYIVSPEAANAAANAVVDARVAAGVLAEEDVGRVGQEILDVLVAENKRSVGWLYGSGAARAEKVTFERRDYPDGLAVAAAAEVRYQSCECPDWERTRACGLLEEALSQAVEDATDRWGFPGLDDLADAVLADPDDDKWGARRFAVRWNCICGGCYTATVVSFDRDGSCLAVREKYVEMDGDQMTVGRMPPTVGDLIRDEEER